MIKGWIEKWPSLSKTFYSDSELFPGYTEDFCYERLSSLEINAYKDKVMALIFLVTYVLSH